jgi:hypothetical protein
MPDTLPGPADTRRERLIDLGWFAALCVWSACWCLTAAPRLGPTYDEPLHLGAGLEAWRFGVAERISIQGNMQLPVKSVALPLYLKEKWTGERFKSVDELLTFLPQARAMSLGWFALLLGSAMLLGRAAAGPWAGRIAAGLIAADPSFLAQAALATTDTPLPATLMAFTLVVYTGRGGNTLQRVIFPGIWFGVAVLTKISALLYGGVIILSLEVLYRFSSGALARPAGASTRTWAVHAIGVAARSIIAVAAVIVIGCVFVLVLGGLSPPGAKPMALVLQMMADDHPLRPLYLKIAEQDRLPYTFVAFLFQYWHNSHGSPTFLNGVAYPEGCWFYFPVLLAIKLPLPILLLGIASLLRPRAGLPFTVVALALLVVTLAAKRQTGIRLVLPVMAVAYVGVAVAVCRGLGAWGRWGGVAAVLATAAVSAWVWPNGLGYLNVLAGGPEKAHERVADSNLDWGQGIPELREWHGANGAPPVAVWYFGTDPAADREPFTQLRIEKTALTTEDEFRALVGSRLLAVGYTVLNVSPFDPEPKAVAMRHLRKLQPVARTTTFAIYDLRVPPP